MKILVLGASGFIGRHIVEGLGTNGYEVQGKWYDFAKKSSLEEWQERLRGFDTVINAVGIIAQTSKSTFQAVHADTPKTLFEACAKVGIQRVIQISALGSEKGKTPYHQSKKAADEYLKSLGIDYAILKPSIVYGEGGQKYGSFQSTCQFPSIAYYS